MRIQEKERVVGYVPLTRTAHLCLQREVLTLNNNAYSQHGTLCGNHVSPWVQVGFSIVKTLDLQGTA